jgi:membrane-bound lytic murein transglycosylase D
MSLRRTKRLKAVLSRAGWSSFIVALVLSGGGQNAAFAAYDQPVTWSDMSNMDLSPVLRSEYASATNLLDPSIPDSATDLVLRDADSHINAEFHVPPSMRESVSFWLKIYTQYTTQHLVIFDSKHPSLIYDVLDFRELAKTSRSQLVYEIVRARRVKKAIASYHQAFASLAKHPHPTHPTREQAIILKEVAKLPHPHTFAELNHGLHAQTGQRDNIVKGLLAAETFFPKMESLFVQMGIPVELTRLSLVESSFDLSAKSRVGAAGIWQFMRPSGKEYLLIDDAHQIDERISPLKATVAAGKLLKRNYGILHDWSLAVTSYNHGIRGLPRVTEKTDRSKLPLIFSPCVKHSRLGWASRNYYAEFLAVVHAEAYRKLYYGDPPPIDSNVKYTQFERLNKTALAANLARAKGISLQEFRLLNPDIRNIHRAIPAGFWIAIPGERDDLVGLTMHVRAKRVRRST